MPVQRTQLLAMLKQYKQNPNLIRADWENIKNILQVLQKKIDAEEKDTVQGKNYTKKKQSQHFKDKNTDKMFAV